ncbi:imelysin family protein [Endozoicomonas arenosclerae]|uniref:imelysin family protein n=1 Tax=Endozoicomonas arenosclerae TaxID=1633495 RepID=UPI000783EE76|nr:imelysin family protein [Endozoicomonas arenosclerae]
MILKRTMAALAVSGLLLAGCSDSQKAEVTGSAPSLNISQQTAQSVIEQYADVAYATFEDALITAKALRVAVGQLVISPNEESLNAARLAWKAARVPYMQSEVFRFGNPVVDDWEGQLNAWPLDEGMIDYVDSSSYGFEMGNAGAQANIVATTELAVGENTLDLEMLTPEKLSSLNELGGSEANVATGYHAVEFLLWGQDLNGTGPGAGERPATDYAKGLDCTNGHCDRRGEYLLKVTDLLIKDLEYMVEQWKPGVAGNYRAELEQGSIDQGLRKMLFGMGSLSLGELAGERMKVALEANSTEDEHDCFSDNTHFSHFYNAQGVQNVFTGSYQRVDGSIVEGPSILEWLKQEEKELSDKAEGQLDNTRTALQAIVDSAENNNVAFDQLIAPDNKEGHVMVQKAINALVEQTTTIEEVASIMGINQLNPDNADHEF